MVTFVADGQMPERKLGQLMFQPFYTCEGIIRSNTSHNFDVLVVVSHRCSNHC